LSSKEINDRKEFAVGILGDDPFGNSLEPIVKKGIEDKPIKITSFKNYKTLSETEKKQLKECRVLYVSESERKNNEAILQEIANYRIMTIGETEDFLENGGTIRFVLQDNKIRFEVNLAAAERAGIKFRSKLMRLANKVTKKDRYSEIKEVVPSAVE